MKTPVLIVIIASCVVLCALPAIYIFLAYQTYKERQRWKADHDTALEKLEAEARRGLQPASASAASAQHQHHQHHHQHHHGQTHQQRATAPVRPAAAHIPGWAPPPPPRELDVFRSSRAHLPSQADAAPRPAPQGSGKSTRPVPGTRTPARSTRAAREKKKQLQQQQRQSSSAYGTTSDENSGGTRPVPPGFQFF